jgi:hypothetical protein
MEELSTYGIIKIWIQNEIKSKNKDTRQNKLKNVSLD